MNTLNKIENLIKREKEIKQYEAMNVYSDDYTAARIDYNNLKEELKNISEEKINTVREILELDEVVEVIIEEENNYSEAVNFVINKIKSINNEYKFEDFRNSVYVILNDKTITTLDTNFIDNQFENKNLIDFFKTISNFTSGMFGYLNEREFNSKEEKNLYKMLAK
jgi:hypothetical protein